MSMPNLPHMDEEGLVAFKDYLSRSRVYVEYGAGGSTFYAAKSARVPIIVSVETDPDWVELMCEELSNISVDLYLEHCDIGPVVDWGRPASNEHYRRYSSYASRPWGRVRELGVVPDTVLIDGRFRVASFLYTLLSARVGTIVMFDDYIDRPHYHVVEQFCPMLELHGRMAVFSVRHCYSLPLLVEAIAFYSLDSE